MLTLNIDLGQVVVTASIGLSAWLLKRELNQITRRLNQHDTAIFELAGSLQRVIGRLAMPERRSHPREVDSSNNSEF